MATTVTRTVGPTGADYTTLANFEAGEQRDLVTLDEIARAECQNFEDTAQASFDGWTTDATRYVEVEALDSHGGVWSTDAYRLNLAPGSGVITVGAMEAHFLGLQVHTTNRFRQAISAVANGAIVETDRVICRGSAHGNPNASHVGIRALEFDDCVFRLKNTLFYDWYDGFNHQPSSTSTVDETILYNCTSADNINNGFRASDARVHTARVKNCVGYNNGAGDMSVGVVSGGTLEASHNATGDGSHPGTNGVTLAADPFVDRANDDYHAAAGSDLIDAGTDLSADPNYAVTTDIDGETRSGTWDIGADEIAGAGGGVTLAVEGTTHGHTADNVALTQGHVLAVQDATHGHTADSPTLSVAVTLAPDDATHAHASESPTLVQANTLAVADASHAHTADGLALTQANVLAPDDAAHAHTAESPTPTVAGALDVHDASHSHTADSPSLTQASQLSVDDASHAHTAESPTLSLSELLELADAFHAHSADALALTVGHVLDVADAGHAHAADGLTLTQANVLVVADTFHAHTADNLTLPGAEVDLRPRFTAAWIDPARGAEWIDPARTASWTDPNRTAEWSDA